MKKILKNKRLLLISLSLTLLLILVSNYIKTTEIELDLLSEPENKVSKKDLFFKAEEKNRGSRLKDKITSQQDFAVENKEKIEKESKADKKIESIALIKEIKDPFQIDLDEKENSKEKTAEVERLKINRKEELIFLEKNIISENIIDKAEKDYNNDEYQIDSDKITSAAKNKVLANNEDSSAANKTQLKNFQLPFKLLGIIKNGTNSSALFFYQGQNIFKKENEKIDIYKIEEINNKYIILSFQDYKRRLHLWEEKNNENEN